MGFVNSKKYDGVQLYQKSNKDISYYIRYRDEANKLRRVKIGDKSKGITENFCFQKRAEILNNIRLGEEPPALAKKKIKKVITLNSIAEIYFKQKELFVEDISKHYRRYPLTVKKKFGEIDIRHITTDVILAFQLEQFKERYAPSTINYNIGFIGRLFNLAIEEDLYHSKNPVLNKKIRNLPVDNERERYLTLSEIKELYENIDDPNIKLFVDLALCTGGRLECILNIKVKDLDLENKIVTLKDTKNQTTYRGFLQKNLNAFLKTYTKGLKANSHIVGGELTKFPTRTIQRKLKNIFDPLFNQGLDKKDRKNRVVIHTLRHTFASHLAINGTPIFTVQKLMNHRDIEMTMRYAKLSPDSGRDFVDELYI